MPRCRPVRGSGKWGPAAFMGDMPARLVMALLFLLWASGQVLTAPAASAHPLGNFTVNTHLGVRVEPTAVALDVVVDIAEVPTLRTFPGLAKGSAGSDEGVAESDRLAYRERTCPALRDAVRLELDGRAVALNLDASSLSFSAGSAGLLTARLECALRSTDALDTVGHELVLTDSLAVQPIGWREITAVGDGVALTGSNVPERSASDGLRSYPEDRLDSPLDQRTAKLRVVRGSGVVTGGTGGSGQPAARELRGVDRWSAAFTDLVATSRLNVGFGVVAVLLAVLLGALHAFAPGHGKTLMAAYLMGRTGTLRQAALIGVSVTLTHTVGVLVLGVLLSVAVVTAPERVYSWLGLASGLLLVAIGLGLLRRARRSARPQEHDHTHDHDDHTSGGREVGHAAHQAPYGTQRPHRDAVGTLARPAKDHHHSGGTGPGQHGHGHGRHGPGHEHVVAGDARSLLAVGFAGGLVPSPSALVVLLAGIALGRAWFGVLLVLAYGIGMALALVGAGLLLVRARDRVERWSMARSRAGRAASGVPALLCRLPSITAGLVVAIGVVLAGQALLRF